MNAACDFLRDILACPVCKSPLTFGPDHIGCARCHRVFPQDSAVVDLRPGRGPVAESATWLSRQEECDRWYRRLLTNPDDAAACFRQDYRPHARFLRSLAGVVLDVGGGIGIVREYLGPNVRYVSLDPSVAWLEPGWEVLSHAFPSLQAAFCFVRGVGESLPFRNSTFDSVLSLWSLNHVSDAAGVLQEMLRVLRPSGRLLIVLEDMPPRWQDFVSRAYWRIGAARTLRSLAALAQHSIMRRPWPVQADHIRIEESAIRQYPALEVLDRTWRAGYLTYELRRAG